MPDLLAFLILANFLLGVHDAYFTERLLQSCGKVAEFNRAITFLSTRLGPRAATMLGVLGPCVGWTLGLSYFNLGVPLALLVGFNLKRFTLHVATLRFLKDAQKIQHLINSAQQLKNLAGKDATLPSDEATSQLPASSLKESK
jgi:hypothetical protein